MTMMIHNMIRMVMTVAITTTLMMITTICLPDTVAMQKV